MIRVTIGSNMGKNVVTISEDTTLREALEAEGINYAVGTTSLDGSPLQPGQMDKTFADMGVTEKCFLMNVVKADNASSAVVAGNVLVVTSDFTYDQLKKVAKYRPDALEEKNEDKEVIFVVGTAKTAAGRLNNYGAEFGTAKNAAGKATITIQIEDGVADGKAWAAEKYGFAIQHLNKVEKAVAAQLAAVDADEKAILDSIKTA